MEELDDAAALMELVLGNRQGELSPLEIGLHVLKAVPLEKGKAGKGLAEYAATIGRGKQYVSEVRQAAEVFVTANLSSQEDKLLDRYKHLAAIHRLRRSNWSPAVAQLRDAAEVAEAVKTSTQVDVLIVNLISPRPSPRSARNPNT